MVIHSENAGLVLTLELWPLNFGPRREDFTQLWRGRTCVHTRARTLTAQMQENSLNGNFQFQSNIALLCLILQSIGIFNSFKLEIHWTEIEGNFHLLKYYHQPKALEIKLFFKVISSCSTELVNFFLFGNTNCICDPKHVDSLYDKPGLSTFKQCNVVNKENLSALIFESQMKPCSFTDVLGKRIYMLHNGMWGSF